MLQLLCFDLMATKGGCLCGAAVLQNIESRSLANLTDNHLLHKERKLSWREGVQQLIDDLAFCEAIAEPVAKRWQGFSLECPMHGILGLDRACVVVVHLQEWHPGPHRGLSRRRIVLHGNRGPGAGGPGKRCTRSPTQRAAWLEGSVGRFQSVRH